MEEASPPTVHDCETEGCEARFQRLYAGGYEPGWLFTPAYPGDGD